MDPQTKLRTFHCNGDHSKSFGKHSPTFKDFDFLARTTDTGRMEFRRATTADAETICTWVTNAEDTYLFAGPSLKYPFTAADFLNPGGSGWAALALVDDGQTVATASYRMVDDHTLRVGRILVDPAMRGRGYGRAMVEHLLALAQDLPGVTAVNLSVFVHNTAARTLYEWLGFAVVETFTAAGPDGRPWQGLRMKIDLSRST